MPLDDVRVARRADMGTKPMMRYAVINKKTGVTEHLYHVLGEAVASAIRLIDEGGDATIIDTQGSAAIEVGRFDLRDAEGYIHRSLGSDEIDQPLPIEEILQAARRRRKEKAHVYHWDSGLDDIRF